MEVNFLLICLISVWFQVSGMKLEEKFVWEELEFDWPSEEAMQDAIDSGTYIPKNNLPLGLDVWHNKIFVTVPR